MVAVGVLERLGPLAPETATTRAAATILNLAESLGLSQKPWSIAELGLDEGDYEWLVMWARSQRGSTARRLVEGWRDVEVDGRRVQLRTAAGLVWTALIAEAARRAAQAGHLWGPVVRAVWDAETDGSQGSSPPPALFVQGQPSAVLKEAIEAAARKFNLRHVFGRSGLQNWYDSLSLQFAFSRRDFDGDEGGHLGAWLSGIPGPIAVTLLADDDGEFRSDSFEQTWQSLRGYRRKNVKLEACRRTLEASSWVLADWVDALLKAVEESRQRIDVEGAAGPTPAASEDFLARPRLEWPYPDRPQYRTSVINLADLELAPGTYSIEVGGRSVAVSVSDGGSASVLALDDTIVLNPEQPTVWATLRSTDGAHQRVQELQLWDSDEELTVFEVDGEGRHSGPITARRRVPDPYREGELDLRKAYVIIAASDLTPGSQEWPYHRLGGDWTAYYVPRGWSPAELRFELDGAVIWSAALAGPDSQRDPVWLGEAKKSLQLKLSAQLARLGGEVDLDVRHADDVAVEAVRVRRQPVPLEGSERGRTRLCGLPVDGAAAAHGFRIELKLRGASGETGWARRDIPVTAQGLAYLGRDGWEYVDPGDEIEAEELFRRRLLVYPGSTVPGQESEQEWGLLEGDVLLRTLTPGECSLYGPLTGVGLPLRLKPGPYNSSDDAVKLVEKVVNRGALRIHQAQVGRDCTTAALILQEAVESSPDHRVLWWEVSGGMVVGEVRSVPESGHRVWKCMFPREVGQPIAVGAGYRGQRIGAWWMPQWVGAFGTVLGAAEDGAALESIARAVRWLQLPVAESGAAELCRELASRAPAEVAEAWLSDDWPVGSLAEPLRQLAGGPGACLPVVGGETWDIALRHTLGEELRDGQVLAALFERLMSAALEGDDDGGVSGAAFVLRHLDAAASVAARLARVHPRLAVVALVSWAVSQGSSEIGRECAEVAKRLLDVAGQDSSASGGDRTPVWQDALDRVIEEVSREIRVDPNFVRQTLREGFPRDAGSSASGGGCDPVAAANYRLLLSSGLFRTVATVDRLGELYSKLPGTSVETRTIGVTG